MSDPKMVSERYWKVLDGHGRSCHGGEFQWSLPRWSPTRGWIPGAWTPRIRSVVPCESGYHVCRDQDVVHWLGARVYACEVRGRVVVAENKVVAESVRLTCPTPWDETSARLFAVECAERVLAEFERDYPTDPRVSDCLVTAYRYALGDATDQDRSAAESAAWSAARNAARGAAESAAWSAAESAAESAARNAAWSAAWSAAESAARSAQTQDLLKWLGA